MAWILGGMMTASLACGCKGGNGTSNGGSSTQPANPCATKNATYPAVISEQPGGTCHNMPSQFCEKPEPGASCEIKVNADGTINLPTNISCASLTVTGCRTRGNDCTYTSNGYSFTENFQTTFAESGIAAAGIIFVTGTDDGQSCASTYDVTATRL